MAYIVLLLKRLLRLAWLLSITLLVLGLLLVMASLGLLLWLVYRLSGRKPRSHPFMRFQQTAGAWRAKTWGGHGNTTAAMSDADVVDVQAREMDASTKRLH